MKLWSTLSPPTTLIAPFNVRPRALKTLSSTSRHSILHKKGRSGQVLSWGLIGDRIARQSVKDRIANCYCRNMCWASRAPSIHDCMPKIKQKQPQDRKTIFETLVARAIRKAIRANRFARSIRAFIARQADLPESLEFPIRAPGGFARIVRTDSRESRH